MQSLRYAARRETLIKGQSSSVPDVYEVRAPAFWRLLQTGCSMRGCEPSFYKRTPGSSGEAGCPV